MVDLLRRPTMNVSPQPVIVTTTQHRRLTPRNRSSTLFNASPVAVNNKIKAIQARKPRHTFVSSDHDYSEIRPLHIGYNGFTGVSNSRTEFSVVTAERLVDRSRDLRLQRITTREVVGPTVLSTTMNQQSLIWPNYQQSNGANKHAHTHSNSTINTSPAVRSTKNNKSTTNGKMIDINRRSTRQPLVDRQSSLSPNELQKKSTLKPKHIDIELMHSPERINNGHNHNHNHITSYESEEDIENANLDEESKQYLEKAIAKCADWLLKYVFIQKLDE